MIAFDFRGQIRDIVAIAGGQAVEPRLQHLAGDMGDRDLEQVANGKYARDEASQLRCVCRAGALAMLVAFWFDGGLFKLATASVFWILLELGSETQDEHV